MGEHINIEEIEGPVALCTMSGVVVRASPVCAQVLSSIGLREVPAQLPASLWRGLETAQGGEVEWRTPGPEQVRVIGCSRYRHRDMYVVMLRDVSGAHAALARRLHRQRLEATGRLVASIAHDLRSIVASVVYSADFLSIGGAGIAESDRREALADILNASSRLQSTVDGLLDYARLGPTIKSKVSLTQVLTRAQGFLRSLFKPEGHTLLIRIHDDEVVGNGLIIEQIFVNLILNALQAGDRIKVEIAAGAAAIPGSGRPGVCVRVLDTGPGIPGDQRDVVFEPFYTTREDGTGLGLPNARMAAESMGGALTLEPSDRGACFAVYFPAPGGAA